MNIVTLSTVSKQVIRTSTTINHHTATGNNTSYGITQCYLLPCSSDFPVFTPAEAGTRFSDLWGMQGWVDLGGGYIPKWFTHQRRRVYRELEDSELVLFNWDLSLMSGNIASVSVSVMAVTVIHSFGYVRLTLECCTWLRAKCSFGSNFGYSHSCFGRSLKEAH